MNRLLTYSIFLISAMAPEIFGQYNIDQLRTIEKVKVSGNIQLEIRIKNEYALEIKSPDLALDCLEHGVEEGVLTLKVRNNLNCSGEAKAILTVPELNEITLYGNAQVSTHEALKTDSLFVVMQLGSKAYLDIETEYLNARLMEGSVLEIGGKTNSQNVSATSKAVFSGWELESKQCHADAGLLASIKVCATEKLEAVSSSGSYISYRCNPQATEFKTSMGGKIEKTE